MLRAYVLVLCGLSQCTGTCTGSLPLLTGPAPSSELLGFEVVGNIVKCRNSLENAPRVPQQTNNTMVKDWDIEDKELPTDYWGRGY